MLLFDKEEKRWLQVADEQLTDALSTGRYVPDKSEQLYLLAPDGTRHTSTYGGAMNALQQGWKIEPEQARRRAYLEKEYGGISGGLTAGLSGLVSGATLGASDVYLNELAPELAEEVQFAREANPVSHIAGEAAGLIGPALAGAPAAAVSTVAQAAGKAGAKATAERLLGFGAAKAVAKTAAEYSPAGILAQLGRRAAKGAASLTGREAESLLPRVVGSVAEAVPATVGLSLGNAAIENKQLTAETLLANVGVSAALATGFPFLVAAATKPFSSMAPEIAKIANKVSGGGHLDDPFDLTVEKKAASWIVKKVAPLSHLMSERPQEFIEAMADPRVMQRAVRELTEVVDNHTGRVVKAVNTADEALERFRTAWGKGTKPKMLAKDFEEVEAVAAADEARGVLRGIHEDLDTYLKAEAEGLAEVGLRGEINGLRREAASVLKRIEAKIAEDPSGVKLSQAVFGEMDELKRGLQRRISAKASQVKRAGRVSDLEAFEILSADSAVVAGRSIQGIETRLRGFLENTQRWGEAGRKQASVNAVYSKLLGHDDILQKHFTKVGDESFIPRFTADDKKFRSLISDSHHETNLRFDEVQGYYKNLTELADVFEKNFEDEALQVAARAAKDQAKVVDKVLQEARKDVSAIQMLSALDRTPSSVMSSAVTGGIVGYHLAGAPGAVGGFLLAGLARPGVLIRRLATIVRASETLRKGVQRRAEGAIRGSFSGASLSLPRMAAPISLATTSYGENKKRDANESRHLAARRIREELKTDPLAVMDRLGDKLADIRDLSPEVADGISGTVGRAHSFLQGKAAEIFGTGHSGSLLQKEKAFGESQVRRWERYVLAVENPLGTIEELFRGYVSTEAAETLRTVYPALHAEVADTIMEALASAKSPPPRATALQFGQFLGIPVDVTASPQFAQRMAARDMQANMPQVTNPEGHAGTTNRPPSSTKVSQKENVYFANATTSQRLVG